MLEVEERNKLSRDVMALSVVVEDEAVVTGKDSFASAASAALAASRGGIGEFGIGEG